MPLEFRIVDGRLVLLMLRMLRMLRMLFILDSRETLGISTLRMKTFSGGSGLADGVATLSGKRFG